MRTALVTFLAAFSFHVRSGAGEENLDVKSGAGVTLPCRFLPTLLQKDSTLYWIRSNRRNHDNVAIGQTAFHQDYRVEYSPGEGMYDLYISHSEYLRDNGRFECRIKEDGTGVELYTKTISLTVLVAPPPPEISVSADTAVEGRPFTLTCLASGGSPPPQITWVRTIDREILEGNTTELDRLGTTQAAGGLGAGAQNQLTLQPSRSEDGAQFTCQVWNRAMPKGEILEKTVNISVNYFPVVSVGPENPYRVELEHTAEMKCTVESKPAAESVKWEFSGRFIDTNFRHVIPQVSLQDAGSYYCTADNGLGQTDKKELVLDVQYGPQIDITGPTEVNEGETISLTCKATSNPRPLGVSWFKKSDPAFRLDGAVLQVPSSKATDGDEYICSSYNFVHPTGGERARREGNSSVAVNVRHRPGRASISPEEAIAVAGRSVTLVCLAEPEGFPKPTYRWWREGRDTAILSTESQYTLSNVDVGSVGRYYCQPHNNIGQGETTSVDLQVYLTPKLTSTPPPSLVKKELTSGLQISCSATAKPKPSVRWFKNGVEISIGASDLYQVSVTEQGQNVLSTLSYVGAARENSNQLTYLDKGDYSCQFENQVGRTEATMSLLLEHKPIPVHLHDKVGFDVGEEGVIRCEMRAYPEPRFDWTLEDDSLESGAVNYQSNVTKIEDDLFVSTLFISKVKSSSYGVYDCRALNSMGSVTARITLQNKGSPEAPEGLSLDEVSAESVLVSWLPGFDGGHKDTEYIVEYTRTADGRSSTFRCPVHSRCNVTGLNQHTEYGVRVKSVNPDGSSGWSDTLQVITKVDVTKIPGPDSVVLETSTGSAHVKVPPSSLELLVELQVETDQGDWVEFARHPLTDSYGQFPMRTEEMDVSALSVTTGDSDSPGAGPLRARLCLASNTTACGPYVVGVVVETLEIGQPWLVALIVVVTLLVLVALLVAIKCVCHSRRPGAKTGARGAGAKKILHPGVLQAHNMDAYKAQMFAVASENQHGARQIYDLNSQQIEQGSSNSQAESANSQEPLWAYQKSPSSSDGMDLHYPPEALAGYDNYPGYPYIDETPTDPDRYFASEHEKLSQNRSSEVMSGEYNCSAAMENSGYSYRGLPDPASYFLHSSTSPNIFHTETSTMEGAQTPNTRARRIVHEVIV